MTVQERALAPVPAIADPDWFAAAHRDHQQAVTAVACRVCGPDRAVDVAQDVFAALWCHPDRYDPNRGSLRSYLVAMARHKAIDVLRSEHSRQAREARVHTAEVGAVAVDDRVVRFDEATRIRAAVDRLPAGEREAILTTFYGDCSYRAAAARLGEPEGTVKSRIRAGLRRLEPALTDPDANGRRTTDGAVWEAPTRWFEAPSEAELQVLALAVGPVLDVGCGPGRHVVALAHAGVDAVGIEFSPRMVELARLRGAHVLEGSIFDEVPGAGRWGTCLLLDGNLGIGARPHTLLRRARQLVRPGGRVLIDAAPPGTSPGRRDLRLAVAGDIGPSFRWADVSIDRVGALADSVGLTLKRTWCADGRWFAWLTVE